jgi:flagellar motor switch protein FliM
VKDNALLTEEEMAALIETPDAQSANQDKRRRVVPYNFRRPDRLSKEQVRALYLLHDLFSHSLSSNLPIFLRTISEVTLISVEQQAYVDYLQGLPDPTAMFSLSMQPLQGVCVLELNPSLAFPVIDRQLGGAGVPVTESRPLTEIEQEILEGFLKLVIDDLREAWKPLVEMEMEIVGRETRPQMLQIVAPNEVVLTIVFQVQVGDARGMMSLCIPALTLEPIVEKFNQSFYSPDREATVEQTYVLLQTLSSVSFPVAAELHGTSAAMEDLMTLATGDVLRLDHPVERAVEISVGGQVKFFGSLTTQNRRTAVQITALNSR